MLGLQMRRAFQRHRPAAIELACSISALVKPRLRQQIEIRRRPACSSGSPSLSVQKVLAQRPFVEHELDVERGRQRLFDLGEFRVAEALGLEPRRD
jgi:hypothetical protein